MKESLAIEDVTGSFGLKPVLDRVLVLRDPAVDKVGSIYLPDMEKYWKKQGEVIAVGPQVKYVKVGDRVVYSSTDEDGEDTLLPIKHGQDDRLALVKSEKYIYCKLHG